MKTFLKVLLGIATFAAGVFAILKIADKIYESKMEELFFEEDDEF